MPYQHPPANDCFLIGPSIRETPKRTPSGVFGWKSVCRRGVGARTPTRAGVCDLMTDVLA